MSTIFYGALISPNSLTSYAALPHAVLSVSKATGVIDWLEEDVPASSLQDVLAKHGILDLSEVELVGLKEGEFLMPGLIDTHTVRILIELGSLRALLDAPTSCSMRLKYPISAGMHSVSLYYRWAMAQGVFVLVDRSMSC